MEANQCFSGEFLIILPIVLHSVLLSVYLAIYNIFAIFEVVS